MVRKWSYLNPLNFDITSSNTAGKLSVYTFKVFRVSTRFKKHNRGPLTVITRKIYSRRKHRTNWLRLTYITKGWVFFFLKSRQFVRFYQNLGLTNVQSFSTTPLVVARKLHEVLYQAGVSTSSCSSNILRPFILKGKPDKYLKNPLAHTPSTSLSSHGLSTVEHLEPVNPGLVHYDNLMYPYNSSFSIIEQKKHILQNTLQVFFRSNVEFVLLINRLLVLLTLHRF